jgi:hypothetical protein
MAQEHMTHPCLLLQRQCTRRRTHFEQDVIVDQEAARAARWRLAPGAT